jgi:hypothetical protein
MNYIRHLEGFYLRLAEDGRLTPFHVSLYLALFRQWNQNRFRNPFPISREELMFFSRIGSVNTYSRCIKQLDEWGYICYKPSFSSNTGSQVSCIRFDKAGDKANDKANDKGADKGTDNAGSKAGDNAGETSYINITNSIKDNKQSPSKKWKNGEGKHGKKDNPYHVSGDKDFSEPL